MTKSRSIQTTERRLGALLAQWHEAVRAEFPLPPPYAGPDVVLHKLVEKTSETAPGSCFVARVRAGSDGHSYIDRAVAQGASLILAQRPLTTLPFSLPPEIPYWQVPDTAETLAWLAAAWEGFPSRALTVIGVTGTDGKTSTANLLFAILQAAGIKAGLLSTVRAVVGDSQEPLELHVTTPEAPVVQRYLRRMVAAGLTHCVLETTSHALEQHRVTAVDFDLAVVTNITHEHLDYHGSYAAYFAAKARLFRGLGIGEWGIPAAKAAGVKTAVLNRDDSSYTSLAAIRTPAQLSYGLQQPATAGFWPAVFASDLSYAPQATRFTLHLPIGSLPITSALLGEFNVYNMLAAATAAYVLGIDPVTIKAGLEQVPTIDGRMQRIDCGQPFLTIVDFAHTPNSLQKVLEAARRMVMPDSDGRVIVVFGSAGKRDVAKRRLMAEVAAREASLTILTAEDPRTESLDDILAMMADGCRSQGGVEKETFWRIPDRGRAIYFALALAHPQDMVLICGKGHEQSMCFGSVEYPWDDRTATRAALEAFLQGAPMLDLGLPTFAALS